MAQIYEAHWPGDIAEVARLWREGLLVRAHGGWAGQVPPGMDAWKLLDESPWPNFGGRSLLFRCPGNQAWPHLVVELKHHRDFRGIKVYSRKPRVKN